MKKSKEWKRLREQPYPAQPLEDPDDIQLSTLVTARPTHQFEQLVYEGPQ
jgi:hypothetical protein